MVLFSALGRRVRHTKAASLENRAAISASALRSWGEIRAMRGYTLPLSGEGTRSTVGPHEITGLGREDRKGGTFQ
jgi:hypothetical protein